MKRNLLAILLVFGLAFGLASAQQAAKTDTLTDAHTTLTYSLDGTQSNCGVTASGTFGSGTLTAKTSANGGTTYSAVSGYADLGNPANPTSTITSAKTLTFPVAGQSNFEVVLSGSTGASILVSIYCNRGVARVGGGGGGSGVSSVTGDPCVVASPTTGNVGLVDVCTPGPQATPSPSATATSTAGPPSVAWTGSFPYGLSVKFPVSGGGGGSTFDPAVLAIASVRHFYPMNDTSPCNTIADAVSGGATAAPSPVPLPTPTTASTIVCGAPPITSDRETSVYFPGIPASGYIPVPQSVWPASGSFTIGIVGNILFQGSGSVSGATGGTYFSVDGSTSLALFQSLYTSGSTGADALDLNGTVVANFDFMSVQNLVFLVTTWDGTTLDLYINGVLAYSSASHAPAFSGGQGALGIFPGGSPKQPALGRLSKFFVANQALSISQIQALTADLGF